MIVIEGLTMPKGEDDGILIALYDGKAHQIGTKETFTASEVPAHGRLIDADELKNRLECVASFEWNQKVGASAGIECAIEYIEDAKTVIEEEVDG